MAARKTTEFMIVNRRTGKALQVQGTDNGQNVVQAAPTGEDAQLWTQVGTRGPVKFINKLSGKALDLVQGGVENGTWAHIWDDVEDAPSQMWENVRITATYKKLRNVQAGKVLDIVDMSEEDGANAQIWEDAEGTGQQWKMVPAGEKAPTLTVTKANKAAAPRVKKAAAAVKEAVESAAKKASKTKKAPAKSKK